jgi:hypothetical protein
MGMYTRIETPAPLVTVGDRMFITTLNASQVESWKRPATGVPSWILTGIFALLAITLAGNAIQQAINQERGSWLPSVALSLMYGVIALTRVLLARKAEKGRGDTFSATHTGQVLAEIPAASDTRFLAMQQAAKSIHASKTVLAETGAWGQAQPETGNKELLTLARRAADLANHHAMQPYDGTALGRGAQISRELDAAVLEAQQVAYLLSTKAQLSQPLDA